MKWVKNKFWNDFRAKCGPFVLISDDEGVVIWAGISIVSRLDGATKIEAHKWMQKQVTKMQKDLND